MSIKNFFSGLYTKKKKVEKVAKKKKVEKKKKHVVK